MTLYTFKQGYLLLSFSTIESAMDAKEALNGQSHELLGNRRVHIKFADEMTDTIEPTRIECTSETAQIVVPGLSIIEDFITEEEEAKYLEKIDQKEWLTTIQRRVQHYGYEFKYDTRDVDPNLPLGEMPWFCQHTITRLKELRPDIESPDQITLNEYLPGQGIAPHVDTPSAFTSYIGSLSLESDIVMDFRLNGTIVKHVLLKRRALCLMTGDARYLWKHGIAYRKSDMINGELRSRERRVSLTLRKISSVLESTESTTETSSSLAPSSIEVEHVHKVYDNIAPHFSHTRHHPWPLVTDFLMGLPSGSLVADVGCGNGKYLGINPKICMIGSDRSIPLMACSTNRE
jgi:alkylated DNA repair protein alkB family protein 8